VFYSYIEKIIINLGSKIFCYIIKRNTADISNTIYFKKVTFSSLDFLFIFNGNGVSTISKKNLKWFFDELS